MLLPNQSRSLLTCEDTNCVAVGSQKKAAEAAKGAQERARTSRAGGELYALRRVGGCSFAATPICKCQREHSRSRKTALCRVSFTNIALVVVAHAQPSCSRTYATQPPPSASSRRRSASLGAMPEAVPSAGEAEGSRSSGSSHRSGRPRSHHDAHPCHGSEAGFVESRSQAANRLRVGAGVARRASFHAAT